MIKRCTTILFLFFLIFSLHSDSENNWSMHEGKKNWKSAYDYCKSIGLRLPTTPELEQINKTKFIINRLRKRVWSSNLHSLAVHDVFNFKTNQIEHHLDTSLVNVICFPSSTNSIKDEEERNKTEARFSSYLGQMKWIEATQRCISLGMRLPTIDELKFAFNSGIMESWKKDGTIYWSSSQYETGSYFLIDINGDTESIISGDTSSYTGEVRCTHKN